MRMHKEVNYLRKISTLLLLLPILFLGSFIFADEESDSDTTEDLEQETEDISSPLPNPGLTPASPFYFLDTFGENVSLLFTGSPEGKANKQLSYANEKLAEAKETAYRGNGKAARKAVDLYENYLNDATENLGKAKALGRDVDALAERITEAILRHVAVLSGVYDKLLAKGNENAAAAVAKAMERQMTTRYEKAQEKISNAQRRSEFKGRGKRVKEILEGKGQDSPEEEL